MQNSFREVAAGENNENAEGLFRRESELYQRKNDIRSPFARDYTRILHSTAYRRLKHKTQVFFNTENDHVCTRMEHVAHVESVAYTVAQYLGLNEELTRAIAFGHDLGHAPFGHHGEKVLNALSEKYLGESFWHEKNGLRLVDELEVLEDNLGVKRNLDLTYAVRDGIISHCGEIDQNGLRPRGELFPLEKIEYAGQYQPATWEGCVVKLADKIAYLGRDIEDALSLGFINAEDLKALTSGALNTTVIMREVISDVCENSSPSEGIKMSDGAFARLSEIKKFNYRNIYSNPRFKAFEQYSELIVNTLFSQLYALCEGGFTFDKLFAYSKYRPNLANGFCDWLKKYCVSEFLPESMREAAQNYRNKKVYGSMENQTVCARAIIDFIAGMTDAYAVRLFEEQLKY